MSAFSYSPVPSENIIVGINRGPIKLYPISTLNDLSRKLYAQLLRLLSFTSFLVATRQERLSHYRLGILLKQTDLEQKSERSCGAALLRNALPKKFRGLEEECVLLVIASLDCARTRDTPNLTRIGPRSCTTNSSASERSDCLTLATLVISCPAASTFLQF